MNLESSGPCYELKLYVAGNTPRSSQAIANLRALCQHLETGYTVEVIDLLQHPKKAKCAQIIATPVLVKESPGPVRKMVGILSDTNRVLAALELQPMDQEGKMK